MNARAVYRMTRFAVLFLMVFHEPPAWAADAGHQLQVFRAGYPRAFFFRSSEGFADNPRISYEEWDRTFRRLMGIEGKVLDEEVPGRSRRNIEFFTRFKRQHPDQLVMLHYNGNARDPRDASKEFFAGHWVYYAGAKILSDLPAGEGETDVRVDDPSIFRVNMGRYRNANEDIGFCVVDGDGKPNWFESEQVQLLSVDARKKTIRVRRGCYGTRPRAFSAGKACAAAHATEGPWGRRSNLMWYYNFSTRCPKDARGRTCADVLAEEVAARFLPGGELAAFDGVEFDVLNHDRFGGAYRPGRGRWGADCDADGKPDNGFFDGINTYGIGVTEFCRRLQDRLAGTKLVLADGASPTNQRAFGILNGIESEGWPHLSDWEIKDWSGGLNRHFFWQQNGRPPVFHYVNHKFTMAGDTPGSRKRPDVPFAVHRLVLAAAQFTDAAVCYSYTPRPEQGERLGIWDELYMGVEHRRGWLGHPLGPAVRLATRQPDRLRGQGVEMQPEFLKRWSGENIHFRIDGTTLRVSRADRTRGPLRFRLHDIPCDGPDLFVSVTMRAAPMIEYPPEVGRLAWVGVAGTGERLVTADLPTMGICLRGRNETDLNPETGAQLRFLPRRALAGESHDCYFVHPPYKGQSGYTYWERDVRIPEGGQLEFYSGMSEKAPGRRDGVTFRVLVAADQHATRRSFTRLFESSQVEARWIRHTVSLAQWSGTTVRLRFVSDCGADNNATTDHSHWGDVRVLARGQEDVQTEPVRFMTWTNRREFTSGFYFSDIRSRRVNLEFSVEGSQPVWISDLTVHAHPDAIYREFEHGLVLANPSPREYTFNLDELLPRRQFRRLRGSANQDRRTNNGSPVAGTVALQGREGLFLVRRAAAQGTMRASRR